MADRRRTIALGALIVAVAGLDQWTKSLARAVLRTEPPRTFLGGVLTLVYAENSGAFLSIGEALPPLVRALLFTVVVVAALAGAAYLLTTGRVHARSDSVAFALLVGGGVGNVIDRLIQGGRVTDFIYLAAGPLHTGVFNVADIAITGAFIWLAVSSLRRQDKAAG
ncbi:MAG: signal peptidase II [Acidobacteriota bacterium]